MKLKSHIKDFVYSSLGLFSFALAEDRVVALMYHSVGDNGMFFSVSEDEFEKQMQYLKEGGYKVLSLPDFYDFFKKGKFPPKTVLITFDDGYLDNYTKALPVLRKFDFPAVVFLATGTVGKEKKLSGGKSLPMMNWEQILNARKENIFDFQPHTVSHNKLSDVSPDTIRSEIMESKKEIENKLNKKCDFFAYPCGSAGPEAIEILKSNNFLAAFSVVAGRIKAGDFPFFLKRNSVDSQTTFSQFKNILKIGKI